METDAKEHFILKKNLLPEWEKNIACGFFSADAEGMWLHMVCHPIPRSCRTGKKKKILEFWKRQYEEIWLEPGLAKILSVSQPDQSEELALFRVLFLANRWYTTASGKSCLEAVVLWDTTVQRMENRNDGEDYILAEQQTDETERSKTETVIRLGAYLADGLNYLTIISSHPEAYSGLSEAVWEEYGLPVRFLEKPVRGYSYGPSPFVLNLDEKRKIRRGLFPQDAKCVYMWSGMLKFLDTIARNGYNT